MILINLYRKVNMKNSKANLDKKSIVKFLALLMKDMKKNYANIGIVTDKDGTIVLNNDLAQILQDMKKKLKNNIWIIVNSGRTVGDMLESLRKENIPSNCFDYIIGDNGGMAIGVKDNQQLFKHTMRNEKVQEIIDEFLNNGGTPQNIRMANGSNIIAYKNREVKGYYKKRKNIVFTKNIEKVNGEDITKLTLTGNREQISRIVSYINENLNEYETHEGKTNFPKAKNNNYRVDCTGKNDKGQAMKYMISKLRLDRCIALGNDLNDLSMFKIALQKGDHIVIAGNEHPEITKQLIAELKGYCCSEKISWTKSNVLVLEEQNVNEFLRKISLIMQIVKDRQNHRKAFINKLEYKEDSKKTNLILNRYNTKSKKQER